MILCVKKKVVNEIYELKKLNYQIKLQTKRIDSLNNILF